MCSDVRTYWENPTFWKNADADNAILCLATGNIMERNKSGRTPLHMAVKFGSVEVVQTLIDAGVSIQALDDSGRPPLYYGVIRGEPGVVRALLVAGACPNTQTGRGVSVLHNSAKMGHVEIVQALLEAGADTELQYKRTGMRALHLAAAWGNVESVRVLLDAGADAGAKDAMGMIPLDYAPESVWELLKTGSDDRQQPKRGAWGMARGVQNRNIMLYWDHAPPPEVYAVVEKWRNVCTEWHVALFNEETACLFLGERYGTSIVELFLSCAIPAMKSDFFRVFWAISEGGIYSDVSFAPKREPLFFDPKKNITVVTNQGAGNIINGIFFAKKGAKELKLVAYEIIKSTSQKRVPYVPIATGPCAWGRALGQKETNQMAIIRLHDLYRFVETSGYTSDLRAPQHWTTQQKRMRIYR